MVKSSGQLSVVPPRISRSPCGLKVAICARVMSCSRASGESVEQTPFLGVLRTPARILGFQRPTAMVNEALAKNLAVPFCVQASS